MVGDFLPFPKVQKREKLIRKNVTFSKVAGFSLQLN